MLNFSNQFSPFHLPKQNHNHLILILNLVQTKSNQNTKKKTKVNKIRKHTSGHPVAASKPADIKIKFG